MGYAQPQPFENGYQTPHPPQGLPAGQHWLNTDPHPDQEDDGFGGRVVKKRPSTKYSARYDPVSDVIKDYLRTSQYDTPTLHPPSATPKYQLEDPGVASSEAPPEEMPGNTRNRSNSNKSGRPTTASSNGSSHAYNTRAITFDPSVPTMKPRPAMAADVAALIRPGWAFVQLLPGKTLRLTLRTPNRVSWRPGQWVNVNIPGVRWWESHPFTIASAHDAEFPTATQFGDGDEELGVKQDRVKGEERTMVLLLRARKGFTKQLWEHVRRKRQLQVKAAIQADSASAVNGPNFAAIGKSTTGVHMRAIVDGPYGSVGRVKWGAHSTIVIICGGSGVSFGMSVLEHLCACIAGAAALGRAGKGGRGFHTQRVRFVWIMREFGK